MPTNTSVKQNKEVVVCFRINKNLGKELDRQLLVTKPVGVRSSNQMARKVIVDYLEGRLAYAHAGMRQALTAN